MPKRRKVSNILALAVLSVALQRPMHPYEMASILRARGKDPDMPIKWGSLYTVVQNLEKHGFLEATGSARSGARPERTVYRITEAGRDELMDWTRELIADAEPEHPRFEAGLSMLSVLGPDVATALLARRLQSLEVQLRAARIALESPRGDIPRLFLLEREYDLVIREAEAHWVRALLDDLRSGAFPDLAGWKSFHLTGQQPPEFAALAERGSTTD
jgi:DNA-binding PadR family transcriptional regulator